MLWSGRWCIRSPSPSMLLRRDCPVPVDSRPIVVRIMERVKVVESGCGLGRGAATPRGYGLITRHGKQQYVHRLMLEEQGTDCAGLLVCHTCDVPACCNPAHLFVG